MAAEIRDRELSTIALKLAEPPGQDADVDGPGRQGPGLVVAHLEKLEPARDLAKARMHEQFPRWTQGAICPTGEVRDVDDHSGRVGRFRDPAFWLDGMVRSCRGGATGSGVNMDRAPYPGVAGRKVLRQ